MSEVTPPSVGRRGAVRWWATTIALGLVVVGVAVVAAVRLFVNGHPSLERRLTCMSNLSRLGALFVADSMRGDPRLTEHGGSALWLRYRKEERVARGDERTLLCPDDASAPPADGPSAWDDLDLARAPRRLCSYPGRDFARFPLDVAEKREPIGACLNHPGGAVVLLADASAQWMTLADLGLASDDDKTVGPDSKSPVLRVLRFGDGSVR